MLPSLQTLRHCVELGATSFSGQFDEVPSVSWWQAWGGSIQLLVLAAVGWLIWTRVRPRPALRIIIRRGVPEIAAGKARSGFLADLADVLTAARITQGTITGNHQNNRLVLKFTAEFSPAVQQQIRNIWYSNC